MVRAIRVYTVFCDASLYRGIKVAQLFKQQDGNETTYDVHENVIDQML